VALALVVINTAFLAIDLATYGAAPAVLAGRLGVSASLLHAWWVTGRPGPAARLRWWLTGHAAVTNAALGLLAWGTGGTESPYAYFLPVVPIVVGIIIPDEPAAPLGAGAAGLLGLLAITPPGAAASHYAFVVVGCGSCSFYGWVAAALYRRLRERERAAAEARERALSELHRSEERRALSERLASLGRLAAGVAHEMNNPLAFVGTNLAFVDAELRGAGAADPEVLAALAESRGGLDRMKHIVQELRGFARGRADGPGPVDAAAALEEARRTLAARFARTARLEVRAAPDLPLVLADRAELVQVLVNLLANAADAVEQQGRTPALVEAELTAFDGGVVVAIADSGPGLSAEAQAHAFEPFFSTKGQRGTGLGLALSREFVERWGGRIEAANRPAGGARLTVVLRRADGMDGPGRGGGGPEGRLAPRVAAAG